MIKKIVIIMLSIMAAFVSVPDARGQGLKNLFKKGVKGPMSVSVANPLARYINVVPIGLYAVSVSEYTNNAYLVLQVTNFTEKENVFFGSDIKNQKMIAVDPAGNVLNIDASGGYRYTCPTDVPVKIVLDNPNLQFMDVKYGTNVMPVVKIGINIDAKRQGNITFKNVPVYWYTLTE